MNPVLPQAPAFSLVPDHLGFLAYLEGVLKQLDHEATVGLALLSLEGVTRIDGMLGYHAGDILCAKMADKVEQALKAGDKVFRIGRNELACVLGRLPAAGHAVLAASRILRSLETRVLVEGSYIHAACRVGVAIGSRDVAANTLLRQAHVAMDKAGHVPERYAVYETQLDEPNRLQFQLQSTLREAIEENALRVCFQPQLNLHTNRISSIETLVRWNHPGTGEIPPSQFIPVAEASGFIADLTLRVLNAALCDYAAMSAEVPDLAVAVNLSAHDLQEKHLPEIVQQMLGTWGVPAERLVLELTETAVMDDEAVYIETLARLRNTGIHLSIDDFGTGYSSMSRLRSLPVNEIKLDISFVRDMLASPRDERIVGSMIALAHDLGMSVVAEGVEDYATLNRLRDYGCDLIQGYCVSKPLNIDELVVFLREWKGVPA